MSATEIALPESSTAEIALPESSTAAARRKHLAELPLVPAGPHTGFVRGTASSFAGIWRYRQLLGLLVRREIKARYKDSFLGLLWSLVRPLSQMLVYTVAIGAFLGASATTRDFPIYIFSGLTVWNLFSEIVNGGTGSIVSNGGLVKKIYLPREVFPLSVIGSALFNFLIQVVILYAATWLTSHHPTPSELVWAVAATGLVLIWATAFSFLLSAVNVYLRDVQYLVEIVLMFGFWLSPVVYQWSQVNRQVGSGFVGDLFLSNPVTLAVMGFHRAFWVDGFVQPQPEHLVSRFLINAAVGLVALAVCQRLFARLQSNFAQEL